MGVPCTSTGYNEEFHSITIIVLWGWTIITSLDESQGMFFIIENIILKKIKDFLRF
jgi:hypothetical protein